MVRHSQELAGHPDRLRWNARYEAKTASFAAHPLAVQALPLAPVSMPVLELAAGPSGSALLAAESGRRVVVVDASDVALELLHAEAVRRGVEHLLALTQADLAVWRPPQASYGLVLCTGYWEGATDLFDAAAAAVTPGGVLAWEALTVAARESHPNVPEAWCVLDGQPASLLPADFRLITQYDPEAAGGSRRRMLARRSG